MARKQERGRKIKEEGSRRRNSEAGETEPATTLGVAEEATIASAGNNWACSDGRCGEDKCGSSARPGIGARTEYGCSSQKGPLCNGGG